MDDFLKALSVRKYLINSALPWASMTSACISNQIACHKYVFQTQDLTAGTIARVCAEGDIAILDNAKIIGLMPPQTDLERDMYPYLQELFGSFFPMDLTVELYADHPFGDYVVCVRTECYRGACIIIDNISGKAHVPVYYLSD